MCLNVLYVLAMTFKRLCAFKHTKSLSSNNFVEFQHFNECGSNVGIGSGCEESKEKENEVESKWRVKKATAVKTKWRKINQLRVSEFESESSS